MFLPAFWSAALQSNNSFKPNLLRYSTVVAEKACHAVAFTAQVGLTQALGPMSKESLVSLLLSLPIGIVSGLYSSLIVTKYARFSELRREALRIIRSINYIGDDTKLQVTEPSNLSALSLIASDLYGLGHRAAGDTISSLYDIILGASMAASSGFITPAAYMTQHGDWQRRAREIGPNKRIYLPWGWP
ncbi:hypothetical protein [Lysobacter sp. A289]